MHVRTVLLGIGFRMLWFYISEQENFHCLSFEREILFLCFFFFIPFMWICGCWTSESTLDLSGSGKTSYWELFGYIHKTYFLFCIQTCFYLWEYPFFPQFFVFNFLLMKSSFWVRKCYVLLEVTSCRCCQWKAFACFNMFKTWCRLGIWNLLWMDYIFREIMRGTPRRDLMFFNKYCIQSF